jgi:uncharacterized repeat protein (TIGR03803 family)
MQRKKCSRTLGLLGRKVLGYGRRGILRHKVLGGGRWGVVVTIVVAALTLASNAATSQPGTEPESATPGEMPALPLVGAAGSELGGEPDAAGAYNILHLFTWAKNPSGNLTFDAAGNLYGTTQNGGSRFFCEAGCGTVWKLARTPKGTFNVSILHIFTFTDGWQPFAGMIFDAAGNLYGTTAGGGATVTEACHDSCGVVFKLAPNPDGTWTESVLHSFTGTDGDLPDAGLIFDAAGNLYGTTFEGGADRSGVVFKLAPNPDGTWTESVLYSFTGGVDGGYPAAGLTLDPAGNLYGTTFEGGADRSGVVFKLAPNPDGTWTESVLYSFTGGADGAYPRGLIFDAAGNLYGTTEYGGAYGDGVVFKLSPRSSGWSETVLHSFLGFGQQPFAPVIFDPAGNLYGTTQWGNGNYGLVFEITR